MKDKAFFGDWSKIKDKIFILEHSVNKKGKTLLRELGRKYLDTVKEHIDKRDLSLPALSPATIERKGHDRILDDTGKFKRKLKLVALTNRSHDIKIGAGAFEDVAYDTEKNMYDLARWIENGTKNQPARPIFRITLKEIMEKNHIPKGLRKFVKSTWRF